MKHASGHNSLGRVHLMLSMKQRIKKVPWF